jgi:hypothetical protein
MFDLKSQGAPTMKCPVCDCEYFYVKNPDNPYKYYQFKLGYTVLQNIKGKILRKL